VREPIGQGGTARWRPRRGAQRQGEPEGGVRPRAMPPWRMRGLPGAASYPHDFLKPLIMVDLDDNRLEVARSFGATDAVDSSTGNAREEILQLTGGRGVDTAIEAVGIPATFQLARRSSRLTA
jgi:hypothetical protein